MVSSASVVVCTRNRAGHLKDVLESLLLQALPPSVGWELLVVDNGSSDETAARVTELAEKAPVELRYLLEPQPGLSRARNRGWRAARGEVVAFLDDDAVAHPHWLAGLLERYDAPEVAAVGGRLLPLLEAGDMRGIEPGWLAVFTFDYGDQPRLLNPLKGSNMSFRRQLLSQVGGFDPRLGRMGRCLLGGDENDLCNAIRRDSRAWRMVYAPDALVHHKLSKEDLSPDRLLKRKYCGGVSGVGLDRKERPALRLWRFVRRHLALGLWVSRALGRRLSGRSLDLEQRARFQEFIGYYKELLGGPTRACGDCPYYADRRQSLSRER